MHQGSTQPNKPSAAATLSTAAFTWGSGSQKHVIWGSGSHALHNAALTTHLVLPYRALYHIPRQHKFIFRVWKIPLNAFGG